MPKLGRTTIVVALAATGAIALSTVTALPSTAAALEEKALARLSAPFIDWNVTLEPRADDPQVLTLEFDSPLLKRRVTNTVFVPDSYQDDGQPSPVLYSLHGTIFPQLNNPALQPVSKHEALLAVTGAGGGWRQTELSKFDSQLHRAKFLVVAPDTSLAKPWCETCVWIDGRDDIVTNVGSPVTAETLPADSHLHQELYPLIEKLFNVRKDRGGRGVTGFSMGAWAAFVQGFKHPDKYGFVAPVSSVYDMMTAPDLEVFLDANGYLRDQGYGTSVTHEVWWRNFNPADIASNVAGVDQRIVFTTGDACFTPKSALSPDCRAYPAALNPLAAFIEVLAHRQFNIARRDLAAKGVTVRLVEMPGVHGANNHRAYSDYIVPEANRVFAEGVKTPRIFSYKAVEKCFSVWGYSVDIERPNDEFLSLVDARMDGRRFGVAGSGVVTILTPPKFTPGSEHTVTITPDSGKPEKASLRADSNGRLPVRIALGSKHLINQSSVTELLALPSRNVNVVID